MCRLEGDAAGEVVIDIVSDSHKEKKNSSTCSKQLIRPVQDAEIDSDPSKLSLVTSEDEVHLSAPGNDGGYTNVRVNFKHHSYRSPSIQKRSQQDHDYCCHLIEYMVMKPSRTSLHCQHPNHSYNSIVTSNTTTLGLDSVTEYDSILESSTCWYSNLCNNSGEALLSNVGLTNVDLEKLADSQSISESMFVMSKSRYEERDQRVKQRREDFLKAMQTSPSQKRRWKHQSVETSMKAAFFTNSLIRRWLQIHMLEIDEITRLLEDITDILYTRERYAIIWSSNTVEDQAHHHSTTKNIKNSPHITNGTPDEYIRARLMVAKSLASVRPTSKSLSSARSLEDCNGVNTWDDPPAWERSRSVSSIASIEWNGHETGSTCCHVPGGNTTASISHEKNERISTETVSERCTISTKGKNQHAATNNWESETTTCAHFVPESSVSKQEESQTTVEGKMLRSRTIRIATPNKKRASRTPKPEYSSKKDHAFQDSKSISSSSSKWIELTDQWIKEPLDQNSVFSLL